MTRLSSLTGTDAGDWEPGDWGFVVALRRRPRFSALMAGAVSAAALPPLNLVPVLLFCLPLLLILVRDAETPWRAATRAGLFGFAHHLLGLYWITEAILFEAAKFWWAVPTAVPALAATLALFIALPGWLAWWLRARALSAALMLAGAWVLADIARAFIATGFPWNPLGSVWEISGGLGTLFSQPASLVGVSGLTLLTLLMGFAPVVGRQATLGALGLLFVWAGFGAWRIRQPLPHAPGVAVVLVQGNAQEDQKWNAARAQEFFGAYLRETRAGVLEARAVAPRVVTVWPETASPYLLANEPAARAAIAQASFGTVVLAGTERFGEDGRPRNALLPVLAGGAMGEAYDKWHLVPFGEFDPDWFPLPFQVVQRGGFARGTGPAVLALPGLPPVGPIICYEAIYSGVITGAERPAWLVNVTNDAWFGDGSGPLQHLAAARMRAIELGLPLMRAANTGVTAGFDAYGRELGRLPRNVRGHLVLALGGATQRDTLYGRYGLTIPVAGASVCCILSLLTIRRRPESQNQPERPVNRIL